MESMDAAVALALGPESTPANTNKLLFNVTVSLLDPLVVLSDYGTAQSQNRERKTRHQTATNRKDAQDTCHVCYR